MIALYIILGILLLIFLVLMIRVEIFATYTDTLTLTLKVLFYKRVLVPAPEQPDKKKKEKKPQKKKAKKKKQPEGEKKEEKKKKSYLGRLKDKKGLTGLLELFTGLARIAGGMLKGLFSHIVIHKMDVGIALHSGDAASTALNYGRVCSVLYPSVNLIAATTVCRDYNVTVEPVFDNEEGTAVYADVHAHLRVIFAVGEALKAAVKALILRMKL